MGTQTNYCVSCDICKKSRRYFVLTFLGACFRKLISFGKWIPSSRSNVFFFFLLLPLLRRVTHFAIQISNSIDISSLSPHSLLPTNGRLYFDKEKRGKKTPFAFYCLFPAGKTYRKNSLGQGGTYFSPPPSRSLTDQLRDLGTKDLPPPRSKTPFPKDPDSRWSRHPKDDRRPNTASKGKTKRRLDPPSRRGGGGIAWEIWKEAPSGKKRRGGAGIGFRCFGLVSEKKVHWYPD